MNKTYMLIHKRLVEIHSDSENVYSTMLLGFFSSDIKCEEAIQYYLKKPGFKDYPDDFKIKTVYADVDDFNSIVGNFIKSVFYLSHEYNDSGYDYVSNLGFYSSEKRAVAALKRYKAGDEYVNCPDGFSIDKYEIDHTEWNEGFFVY